MTPTMKFAMEEVNENKIKPIFFGHHHLQGRQKHIIQYIQETPQQHTP
jgi:hypothetical protein